MARVVRFDPARDPDPVPSPCVSLCGMGADGLCRGCRRTLDEIAGWSRFDDAARRAVWRQVLARRATDRPAP